jgi:HEAT repeat protein
LEGVQRLAADRLVAARDLLATEGSDMRRAALSLISGLGDQYALPFLEELLSHENADLRVAALGQIRKRLDNDRLAGLLRKYTELATYYYNVVAWLDRMIYAPPPISNYYEEELEGKLGALDR